MNQIHILWVDDEIDLLKPHILFLEMKNYKLTTCNNGRDAIDLFAQENFDIVFLDENMPGMSGLETLAEMKEKKSATILFQPQVVDTKMTTLIIEKTEKPINNHFIFNEKWIPRSPAPARIPSRSNG